MSSISAPDRKTLDELCRRAGADDVGFVELDRDGLEAQRESMRRALPWARTFMVFARRLNRHAIRSPLYSISSAEFVAGAHDVKAIIHRTVRDLETRGIRAVGVGSFPMEFGRPDGSPFVLQLKYLAEAAGLGVMGKNRMVLHPHFGADVYLGAIVLDCTIEPCDQPLG
jgi:epoxyqueuosine reductase QueG